MEHKGDTMNVQQVIEELQKIPNKNLKVIVNNKTIKSVEIKKSSVVLKNDCFIYDGWGTRLW